MEVEQVVVIGAGPAGLATALQLKRQGIDVLLLERGRVGGLLHNANLVENYPGFPGGLPGPELVASFVQQAIEIGVEFTVEEVKLLDFEDNDFQITTAEHMYRAGIVVLATGTKPKTFSDVKIPEHLLERVFYEVFPLLGTEGKRIAILGAGDAAFDYALNLSKSNEVLILNRGKDISCLPLLWERAQQLGSIQYFEKTHLLAVEDVSQGGLRLVCKNSDGEITFSVDDIIGAIGREPRLDFLSDNLLDKVGQLQDNGAIYFVGDVKNGLYRQTAIAVGDGVKAAMEIGQHLKEISSMEHAL